MSDGKGGRLNWLIVGLIIILIINANLSPADSVTGASSPAQPGSAPNSNPAGSSQITGQTSAPQTRQHPAPTPARFDLSNAKLSSTRVGPSEAFTVSVDVRNTGGQSGSITVFARVPGGTIGTTNVSVAAGGSTAAKIPASLTKPGDYTVTVSSASLSTTLKAGTVHVMTPAALTMQLSVSPSVIQLGDSATATATISNSGEMDGFPTLNWALDYSDIGSSSPKIPGGDTSRPTFEVTPSSGGTKSVQASLSTGISRSVNLKVLSPTLADGSWTNTDRWCGDGIPFKATFTNKGDGVARGVYATIQLFNANDELVDTQSTNVGDVAAGGVGTTNVELAAHDNCGQYDYFYAYVIFNPRFGQPLSFTTTSFHI